VLGFVSDVMFMSGFQFGLVKLRFVGWAVQVGVLCESWVFILKWSKLQVNPMGEVVDLYQYTGL
jgi:hypothetical protein